eukprot:Em0005g199a
MSKRSVDAEPSSADDSAQMVKKFCHDESNSYTQQGLDDFFSGSAEPSFAAARIFGLKVYSRSEIDDSNSEMEQQFRRFWNQKGDEICQSKLFKSKRAVQGAINSAWMMKKSELLIAEFDHLRQVAKEVYTEKNFYEKLKSIDCNLDKLKQNMFSLTSDYNRLTSESSYSDRIKVGNDVHRGLEAIKKLHEALRKGMERLRKDLFKATIKDSVDSTANYISSEAALDAVSGLDQFGARGGPSSIIYVMYDELAQCNGEYGCKRFLRDGYQTVKEDPHRQHYEYSELKVFENIECEWPLFVIYLAINGVLDGNGEEMERYYTMTLCTYQSCTWFQRTRGTEKFLDHEAFYLCLDNSLLVDLIRTDIAYLKTNWKLVGRPTIVLPILRHHL